MTGDLAAALIAVGGSVLLLATGAFAAPVLARLSRAGRCNCGHPYSYLDSGTGGCKGSIVQKQWISGARRGRKRIPCPCTQHYVGQLSDIAAEPSDTGSPV
jgi:hypothetical protein